MKRLKKCSIDSCSKVAESKGLCVMHYTRFLRHGDPLTVKAPSYKDTNCLRCEVPHELHKFGFRYGFCTQCFGKYSRYLVKKYNTQMERDIFAIRRRKRNEEI